MNRQTSCRLIVMLMILGMTGTAFAAADTDQSSLDIYGHVMLDIGYQTGQSDPNWFDVARPTKLPTYKNEYGGDGHYYASVRQTRFGVKGFQPTEHGAIKTIFEFELFGVGTDEGQTTFRLRHAYGEYNKWGAGQYWSTFMDPDVFPNSVEYWGPNGMIFYRNIQLRFMPIQGDSQLTFSLEKPGGSGDPGVLVGDPRLENISTRWPAPDVVAQYRRTTGWGHYQAAGIVRYGKWDDLGDDDEDVSNDFVGWGVNLSTNIKFAEDILKLQVVYGEGIANYSNDGGADVGALEPGNPDIAESLPLLGVVAFYDRTWNKRFTSTFGYSLVDIDNSVGQSASSFKKGQYALANLLYHPAKNLMWGVEVQWVKRENLGDGQVQEINGVDRLIESADDLRFQVSVKYNFGHRVGG